MLQNAGIIESPMLMADVHASQVPRLRWDMSPIVGAAQPARAADRASRSPSARARAAADAQIVSLRLVIALRARSAK